MPRITAAVSGCAAGPVTCGTALLAQQGSASGATYSLSKTSGF